MAGLFKKNPAQPTNNNNKKKHNFFLHLFLDPLKQFITL